MPTRDDWYRPNVLKHKLEFSRYQAFHRLSSAKNDDAELDCEVQFQGPEHSRDMGVLRVCLPDHIPVGVGWDNLAHGPAAGFAGS